MRKLILIIAIGAFAACNNEGTGTSDGSDNSSMSNGDSATLITPDTTLSHDSMSSMTPDTTSN